MPCYKNISATTKTVYGVTFLPGEVKCVPGYITSRNFISASPESIKEPPKTAKKPEAQKSQPKPEAKKESKPKDEPKPKAEEKSPEPEEEKPEIEDTKSIKEEQ